MVKKTEKKVCEELKRWFNSCNIKCWLNEGDQRFNVIGSRKKPDLLIFSERLKQYIIIEVKCGDISSALFDASKILEYYREYYSGDVKYTITRHNIKISSFTVASMFSMFGKLFKEEGQPLGMEHWDDRWKRVNKERGLEPIWEYPRTHDYLRSLWSSWKKFRKREPMPGVGIILSNGLNHPKLQTGVGPPLLFDMQWEVLKKPQWRARQKIL